SQSRTAGSTKSVRPNSGFDLSRVLRAAVVELASHGPRSGRYTDRPVACSPKPAVRSLIRVLENSRTARGSGAAGAPGPGALRYRTPWSARRSDSRAPGAPPAVGRAPWASTRIRASRDRAVAGLPAGRARGRTARPGVARCIEFPVARRLIPSAAV